MISPSLVPTATVRVLAPAQAESAAPVRLAPAAVAAPHVVPRQATVDDAPRRVTLAQARAALRGLDRAR